MFGLGKYITIAAAVALLIAGGIIWFQHGEIGSLREAVATERANVATLKNQIGEQNKAIDRLRLQRESDQAEIGRLSERANLIQMERDNVIAKYNEYRTRLGKAAMARPSLVGRIASRATMRVMRDFFRASGGKNGDGGNPPVRSAAPGTDQPAAGEDRYPDPGGDSPTQ